MTARAAASFGSDSRAWQSACEPRAWSSPDSGAEVRRPATPQPPAACAAAGTPPLLIEQCWNAAPTCRRRESPVALATPRRALARRSRSRDGGECCSRSCGAARRRRWWPPSPAGCRRCAPAPRPPAHRPRDSVPDGRSVRSVSANPCPRGCHHPTDAPARAPTGPGSVRVLARPCHPCQAGRRIVLQRMADLHRPRPAPARKPGAPRHSAPAPARHCRGRPEPVLPRNAPLLPRRCPGRARERVSARGVAVPQGEGRQVAQRAGFSGPIAVGAAQPKTLLELALRALELAQIEPGHPQIAQRDGLRRRFPSHDRSTASVASVRGSPRDRLAGWR